MNLTDLLSKITSEKQARAYLESIRWPNGVKCLRCGCTTISRLEKYKRFECADCEYQFSVTVGTIFHRTRVEIRKWLITIYMMCEGKKGISACEIQRMIGVSYPTAWYMCHRIRNAMTSNGEPERLFGIIEIDETYVGPKSKKRGRPGPNSPKTPILGMIERGGKIVTRKVDRVTRDEIRAFVFDHAYDAEVINTDEFKAYNVLKPYWEHKSVNHSLMYSDGDVHCNGVENFWSLLKRGIIGTFHKISTKHLERYLAEFTWRFNSRKESNLLELVLGNCEQQHMSYAELTEEVTDVRT